MILGISASGRENRITSQTVKAILEATGMEYEFITLAGKCIKGCIGCTQCAADNICKLQDDWNKVGEAMIKSDVIVFGAPNYYGNINALGHACLERTFSFRHREVYSLQNKIGISVSTGNYEEGHPVHSLIKKFMLINKMNVLGQVTASGYSQCYTCGFGHSCGSGSVVSKHGYLDKIEKKHLPLDFAEQEKTQQQINEVVRLLKGQFPHKSLI
jgi:multimeric flavodoxin WrbA